MAETCDLLFELGTEELPPKSLRTLQGALKQNVEAGLAEADLAHGQVFAYATPRRLALLIRDLARRQPDKTVEKRGPAVSAAFAADGAPTKAALGFADGCGATVDRLGRFKTDKGEWLVYREAIKGVPAETLIPDILREALTALPTPKRMRWGAFSTEFVRPVHWAVLLYGDKPIETEILGVQSGGATYGHRFHHPEPIVLNSPCEYAERLRSEGHVIADFEERRKLIQAAARLAAEEVGGVAHIEEELLEEIAALNEWPVPVVGEFEAGFLNLPAEVLITTMQSNQKYIPVKNAEGRLLHHFITFSNIDSKNPEAVRRGNERVIRPRLTDAEFFWEKDRKTPLAERVNALSHIVFQQKLGTLADKTARMEKLAGQIARLLDADVSLAVRAARLSKADLLTEMVGEFPNLQGTMGRYYALADGEPEEVARALEEQYFPRQSGAELPKTRTGEILSLAEKIDTLAGIFSAGLIPSGDKDPYALRRAALGALRILVECRLDLSLDVLVDFALGQFNHDFDKQIVSNRVNGFILERLRGYALEIGFRHDEIDTVLDFYGRNPLDFEHRLRAVQEFRSLPEAGALASANKRIRNLLRKSEVEIADKVDEIRFEKDEEKALFDAAREAHQDIVPLMDAREYTAALRRLALLRPTVDAFFDNVMAMAEDAAVRANRLALLALLENLFLDIADISKLQINWGEGTLSPLTATGAGSTA